MARLTTQSYVKITLIILLGLLLLGLAGLGSCSPFHLNFGGSSLSQTGDAEVDAARIKNIDIDWAAGSVDIKVHSDGEKIILKESTTGSVSRAQAMRWQVVEDTLKVDYGTGFACMGLSSKHLELSIPQSLAKNLGIVDIDGASGDYTVNDIACDSFKVSLASGSLNAKGMRMRDLDLDVASGNSFVEGEVSERIKTDVASGLIEVVSSKVYPQSIDANMASGTVSISIPENDGFTAQIDKLSGRFESDFATQQKGNSYVYKNGGMSIKADMASGQFNLKKTR